MQLRAVHTVIAGILAAAFWYAAVVPGRAGPAVTEALVTNQTGDSLSIVSLRDMKTVAEIAVEGKPAGIAVSPDGSRAYLSAPEGKDVIVVDVAARKILRRIKVGEAPLGILPIRRTG